MNWDLLNAIEQGKISEVQRLLDSGVDINAPIGDYDSTPLMEAAGNGHMNLTRILLQRGANVNATTVWGDTALSGACIIGNTGIVQLLPENGADIECRHKTWGETPLMFAAAFGHVKVLNLLLKAGADLEARDNRGSTALLEASSGGQTDAIRFLLKQGANLHVTGECHTALAMAALEGHLDSIRFLLECGVDINEVAPDGATALTHAIWREQQDTIAFLKQSGATE